jgi:hypothetical protein
VVIDKGWPIIPADGSLRLNGRYAQYGETSGMGPIKDENMETDLRSRVVALEQKSQAVEPRFIVIETWQRQADIFNARKDEQFENLKGRFDSLDRKLDGVSGGISKVLWMIAASVVVVVVGFALKGGFIAT